jgi:hypothetical protein
LEKNEKRNENKVSARSTSSSSLRANVAAANADNNSIERT